MDVRNLGFDDDSFDVAIDKGPTSNARLLLNYFQSEVNLNRYHGCYDDI